MYLLLRDIAIEYCDIFNSLQYNILIFLFFLFSILCIIIRFFTIKQQMRTIVIHLQ